MTKEDAVKAVAFMRGAYPKYFKNIPDEEYPGIVFRLLGAFKDCSVEDVALGIRSYIGADQSGLPPSNGEIMHHMLKSKDPAGNRAALQAWDAVKKAIRMPDGHMAAAFGVLPEPAKQALGDYERLFGIRAQAKTDPERFETQIQLDFFLAFQEMARRMATAPQQQEGERSRLHGLKERLQK